MANRVQKRISLRRKLHILRALINSNSAKNTNTTTLQLYKLKALLETVKREYDNLIAARRGYQNHKEVKVEKVAEGTFVVKINCERGGDKLVAILEAFEEMGVDVEQARVSCNDAFSMEAIVVAEDQAMKESNVVESLVEAIGKKNSGSES
ncbi:transcription regulators protein [Senna tora]|uniref:Transcription regulators protein n=1 Tax=Senna tora TaxID=362788 RepID=A0A834SGQ8_9FABA|nr:transcription regulators protein [Senna tora]